MYQAAEALMQPVSSGSIPITERVED